MTYKTLPDINTDIPYNNFHTKFNWSSSTSHINLNANDNTIIGTHAAIILKNDLNFENNPKCNMEFKHNINNVAFITPPTAAPYPNPADPNLPIKIKSARIFIPDENSTIIIGNNIDFTAIKNLILIKKIPCPTMATA